MIGQGESEGERGGEGGEEERRMMEEAERE